jgi:hypothetical protein
MLPPSSVKALVGVGVGVVGFVGSSRGWKEVGPLVLQLVMSVADWRAETRD